MLRQAVIIRSFTVVLAGLWLGAVFCIGYVIAPYLFALAARHSTAVPNTTVAAQIIGPLLHGANLATMVGGAIMIASLAFLRRQGEQPMGARWFVPEIGAVFAILSAAINSWVMTPQIHVVKSQLAARYGAFHLADHADPLYRHFGGLHGASSVLFMLGFVGALLSLICLVHYRRGEAKLTGGKLEAAE